MNHLASKYRSINCGKPMLLQNRLFISRCVKPIITQDWSQMTKPKLDPLPLRGNGGGVKTSSIEWQSRFNVGIFQQSAQCLRLSTTRIPTPWLKENCDISLYCKVLHTCLKILWSVKSWRRRRIKLDLLTKKHWSILKSLSLFLVTFGKTGWVSNMAFVTTYFKWV